jgi:hypothetical protein
MTVTAPETALRERLISILTDEFETEEVEIRDDKIHDSLAQKKPLGGVYPTSSKEQFGQGLVQDTFVMVQLFRQWDREINAEQTVSPAGIEEWAERLRRACRADELGAPGDVHLWYYRVVSIEFPDDPSGNKTRLLATVQASSQNAGLTETSG